MNRVIIRSSLPLHIIPGVGCGGVILLGEDESNGNELPQEPERKALLYLENSSKERDGTNP
jgi:hypothetical protein